MPDCTTDTNPAINGSVSFEGGEVLDVRDISFTRNKAEKQYASSCTQGRINRRVGHQDKFGSFTAYVPATPSGPDDLEPFVEGSEGALQINSDTGQILYNEGAIILSLEYGVPIEGGDLVEVNVTWGRILDPTP